MALRRNGSRDCGLTWPGFVRTMKWLPWRLVGRRTTYTSCSTCRRVSRWQRLSDCSKRIRRNGWVNREKIFRGRKGTRRSVSVRRIWIRRRDTSRIRRRTIGRPVSRRNFGRCFGSMAWNMIPNSCLVSRVSPLRGFVFRVDPHPPLPRWATIFRP
jgi:hypothetical protein